MAQNVSDQIAKLNILMRPIAIIHATDDLAIRLDYLKKLRIKNLWNKEIQLISDCGHFMIAEKPAELASLLDQFFSES